MNNNTPESSETITASLESINEIRSKFYEHVDKNGPIPEHVPNIGNCWIWTGIMNDQGYGMFYARFLGTKNGHGRAHRASWAIEFGQFQKHKKVLHKCDNRACVRPDHLFLGSQGDNILDMCSKGRCNFKPGHIPPVAKLTKEQVIEIKNRLANKEPQLPIALKFGVKRNTISTIKHGKSWKHVMASGELLEPLASVAG